MTHQNKQRGAAHLILVIFSVVVIVGLLGFVGYNAYQKKNANAGTDGTLGSPTMVDVNRRSNSTTKQPAAEITFGFQNIGRKERSTYAVTNTIRSRMPKTNVFLGFAEIDSKDTGEHRALQSTFGASNWTGFSYPIPLRGVLESKYNRVWKSNGAEHVYLSRGVAGISPARYYNAVKYRRSDGLKLAVINTHFMYGAYNDTLHRGDLQKIWNAAFTTLRASVRRLSKSGYNVVVMGDFNRSGKYGFPLLTSNTLYGNAYGYDRIYAVPASNSTVKVLSRGTVATPSGESFHRLVWSKISFRLK